MNSILTAEETDFLALETSDEIDLWDAVNENFLIEVCAGLDAPAGRPEAIVAEVLRAA